MRYTSFLRYRGTSDVETAVKERVMIATHCVRCPGCAEGIRLRLGIGREASQPFYFVCPNCGAATRGEVDASSPPALAVHFEEELETLQLDDCSVVLTLDPMFPTRIHASDMGDVGGSPFMLHFQILGGETLTSTQARIERLCGPLDRDGPSIRRVFEYYKARNWPHFDNAMIAIGVEGEPAAPWQRHDAFHRMLEVATAPIWSAPDYVDAKSEWAEMAQLIVKGPAEPQARKFFLSVRNDHGLDDYQLDLLASVEHYLEARAAILPGFVRSLYPAELALLDELRLLRDDFKDLRDYYIQVFEACHHILPLIIRWLNLRHRSNPDVSAPQKEVRKTPKTIRQLSKLSSYEKVLFLREEPWLHDFWTTHLDRSLRNSLGHSAARHDLSSGMVVLRGRTDIPYLEFVHKCYQTVYPLLFALQVVKLGFVYEGMLTKERSGEGEGSSGNDV